MNKELITQLGHLSCNTLALYPEGAQSSVTQMPVSLILDLSTGHTKGIRKLSMTIISGSHQRNKEIKHNDYIRNKGIRKSSMTIIRVKQRDKEIKHDNYIRVKQRNKEIKHDQTNMDCK